MKPIRMIAYYAIRALAVMSMIVAAPFAVLAIGLGEWSRDVDPRA